MHFQFSYMDTILFCLKITHIAILQQYWEETTLYFLVHFLAQYSNAPVLNVDNLKLNVPKFRFSVLRFTFNNKTNAV